MLELAREKIAAGCSKRQIAKDFGINEAALRQRMKSGTGVKKNGRFENVFTENQQQH